MDSNSENNLEVVHDELSGLYNREYISMRLPDDIETCLRLQLPLSLIIADIDFFGDINENCGHTAGDQVIKHFSQLLQTEVDRLQGWTARYSGEEFMICLPRTALQDARWLAERLRQSLELSTVVYRDITIKLTASFGLAALGEKVLDGDALIALAEMKLLEAKQNGRNQVRS